MKRKIKVAVRIFVDESGTLPDPKDRVIVVAAVGTQSPLIIEKILKTVREKGKFKKKTSEIKYYTSSDKTKTLFFEKFIKEDFDIFILTVEKMGRKIPDTPRHFATLCWLLLSGVFSFYTQIEKIIFDRHFHRNQDTEEFNQFLIKMMGSTIEIEHVDSQRNQQVNIADMIAGAVLAKEVRKDGRFYKMFKKQIICETRINWPEAKRKLFKQKSA